MCLRPGRHGAFTTSGALIRGFAPRVDFLPEPAGFGERWRELGERVVGGPNAWTDAYLAAFAVVTDATIVTLDRKLSTRGAAKVQYLL